MKRKPFLTNLWIFTIIFFPFLDADLAGFVVASFVREVGSKRRVSLSRAIQPWALAIVTAKAKEGWLPLP